MIKYLLRRVWPYIEWYVVVPIRKVRNRIGCLFGRHFAWNPYFYKSYGGQVGPYAGIKRCVSCGKEKRESWAMR